MARILIFSTEVLRAELVRVALVDLAVEVRVAHDLASLYRLTEQSVYELVLFVGVWPFRCGTDLLSRLRPRSLPRPELFVLSWQHDEQTVLSLLESGVDQYMTFPLNMGRLRAKIIGVLEP